MEALAKAFGLPTYDGTKDVKEFLKAFKLQALVFSWDEAKQCQCIQYLLKGKAERLFEALAPGEEKKIESIFKCLQEGCIVPQEVLLDRFFERKPKPNELLSTFAISLQALLFKAMPDLPTKDKNIFLRRQLGVYMPDHMRALVHFNTQKTWDELLTAIDQSMPHAVAGTSINKAQKSEYSEDGNFYAESIVTIKTEPVDINSISGTRPSFNGNCRYCKEPGHMVIDCQAAKLASSRKENQKTSNYASNVQSNDRPSYRTTRSNERDSKTGQNSGMGNGQFRNLGNKRYNNDRNFNALELKDDEETVYDDEPECDDY